MTQPLARFGRLQIDSERDVVLARRRARDLAAALGLDTLEQSRLATAVSEVAGNAHRHAGGGTVDFLVEGGPPTELRVLVADDGPGIRGIDAALALPERSAGMGLAGVRRMVDRLDISSEPGRGTRVLLARTLPGPTRSEGELLEILERPAPQDPYEEMLAQNRELLVALAEVREQRERLSQLNRELEDTNRGVVALYAELDVKAESLQRATETKSRFLSHMSHEFKTPVNTILSLSRLLLDGLEGPLSAGQEKAVTLLRGSAMDLTEMVNDLLDLARAEAGKLAVRPSAFDAGRLLGAVRGMFKPVLLSQSVQLVIEDPDEAIPLHTDEGKVSQIVRNFVSNALKFTERGEVRVRAFRSTGSRVSFACTDTGIGIAPEDVTRVFDEFSQIDGPLQRKVKGTGLGLPLAKRLAEMLGGAIAVHSEPGAGSTFTLTIPATYSGPTEASLVAGKEARLGG